MTANAICAHCGSPLPADAIAGQCPACLLNLALTRDDDLPEADLPFDSTRRRFGDYVLGLQIGAGGMGVVYEAHRASDGAKVALKLIRDFHTASPAAVCRFTIEAEAASRLDHPAIVRIHEVGESHGHPFFSMDFIEGQSLSTKIARGELAWSQVEIAGLMTKIARAVHHAHLRGVLHRDLKPGNIIIDPRGEPHLTDFGLAKILQPDGDARTLTGSGDAPGTPSYMSPEQVRGEDIGCAADIYGLGAVLYALLTARPPFQGTSPLETFAAIVGHPPTRPRALNSAIDPRLETICLKCLEKDPRQRYGTAEALAEDLENFAAGRAIQARSPGVLYRTAQWIKRNPLGAGLIGSLCLGLAVALVLLKVVTDQRREIQLDRDLAFDEGMQKISEIWRDPATTAVTISARELNILAGRSPVDLRLATRQFTFGITADDGPSSMAQRYARLLGAFQQDMERALGEKTAFHLRLLKRFNDDEITLARGEVDFMVLSAVKFLQAQRVSPQVSMIAHANTAREGVIFASTNAGIDRLADLRGKSIAFPNPDLSLAVSAQAALVGAHLRGKDLARTTNVTDAIPLVLRGEFDAGVTHRLQFERYRHLGLVMLDRFPETPDVLAARAGLDPTASDALRHVIGSAAWPADKFIAGNNQQSLDTLRSAMKQAELFAQPKMP